MTREELKIEQEVSFGRPNGKTRNGVIVKLNPKNAQVKEKGTPGLWVVPYASIKHIETPDQQEITYNPFNKVENLLLEAVCEIYFQLSPENLTRDGEIPYNKVAPIRKRLEHQLQHLQQALQRTVTEHQAYEWDRQRKTKA